MSQPEVERPLSEGDRVAIVNAYGRRVIGVVDAVWPDGQARIVVDEHVEGLYAESEIERVDG